MADGVLNPEKIKLHEKFQHTSHHGITWAKGTYCVMEWDDQVLVVEQTPGGPENHAERNLIRLLDPVLQTGEELTIYINRSSCDACVPALIDWKDDKNLNLNLIYAGLYQCHRVSCGRCNNPTANYYRVNTEAMQDLMRADNITVRGFQELQDWKDLCDLINGSNQEGDPCSYSETEYTTPVTGEEMRLHGTQGTRQHEDELLAADLAAIPGLVYNTETGRFA